MAHRCSSTPRAPALWLERTAPMRNNSSRILLTLGALMVLASLAPAATWTVERDGTGDFTVIQEAVDVAADGDTIRIGPGRYDEKTLFVTPGWSEFVRVIVRQ